MKKIKLNTSKLELSKRKVSSLSKDQMNKLYGGTDDTYCLSNDSCICATQQICSIGCPPPSTYCTPTSNGCSAEWPCTIPRVCTNTTVTTVPTLP